MLQQHQISRNHRIQTTVPRDFSHKNTPPRPPAQELLTNQRSIPTEGKIKRRTSRDSVPDVYKNIKT
jgi:hypothetical protein